MQIEGRPGPEFARVARALKRMDSRDLENEYKKGIQKAAGPLGDAVRADIPLYMPQGYEPVLLASIKVNARPAVSANGIRITAAAGGRAKRRELGRLQRGTIRHPVYGYVRFSKAIGQHVATTWVTQAIRPGFFTEPITRNAALVKAELVKVMQQVADKLTRG